MARHSSTGGEWWNSPDRADVHHLLVVGLAVFLLVCGIGFTTFLLWPRAFGPMTGADAPSVPVTIAGTAFNVPSAAIRVAQQRRPGAQDRVDLAFLWPSLAPPDAAVKREITDQPLVVDRLFVTIAVQTGSVAASELTKVVYPRYLTGTPLAGPAGLAALPFRDGSPYQGEDLLYDPAAPDKFVSRCSRPGAAATLGVCLLERRIGAADVTVRFPREWLADWHDLERGIDRLIASMRPAAS